MYSSVTISICLLLVSCRLSIARDSQQLGFKEKCGGENEEESNKCVTNMCQEIEDPAAGGYDDLDDLDDADYELEKSYECVCPSYWHQFNHGTNDHICERGGMSSFCLQDTDCSYGEYDRRAHKIHTTFFYCDKTKQQCNCNPGYFYNATLKHCQASQHMKPCSTHSERQCSEGAECIRDHTSVGGGLAAPYCNCTFGEIDGSCVPIKMDKKENQCLNHLDCNDISEGGFKLRNFQCVNKKCKCVIEPLRKRRVKDVSRWRKGDKVVMETEQIIICARLPKRVGDMCANTARCLDNIKGHAECDQKTKRCTCKIGYLESPSGQHCFPAVQHKQRSLWQWFWGHTSKYATSLYFDVIDTASSYVFKSRDSQVDFDGKFHFYRGQSNRKPGLNEAASERKLMREGAPIDTLYNCDFGSKAARNCSISTSKCTPSVVNLNATSGGVSYPDIVNDFYMYVNAKSAAKAQSPFSCQVFLPLIKSSSKTMCLTFEYLFEVSGAGISICRGQGTSVGECNDNIAVNSKMTTWGHASVDVEYIENSKIVLSFEGFYEAEKGILAVDNIHVMTGKCSST